MDMINDRMSYYQQQLSLSRQLLNITESIFELTRDGNLEEIDVRITKREDIINQLKSLEKRWPSKRMSRKCLKESINRYDDNNLPDLINNINNTIHKVNALDKGIAAFILCERDNIAQKLEKVSTGHKLIKKYLPPRIDNPQYFSFSI